MKIHIHPASISPMASRNSCKLWIFLTFTLAVTPIADSKNRFKAAEPISTIGPIGSGVAEKVLNVSVNRWGAEVTRPTRVKLMNVLVHLSSLEYYFPLKSIVRCSVILCIASVTMSDSTHNPVNR